MQGAGARIGVQARTGWRPAAGAAPAFAAAVLLGGAGAACGGDDPGTGRVAFSQVEVQAYLEREVARTLPGLDVGVAACPPTLPAQPGGTVTCAVTVGRVTLDYEVERLVGGRFEARPQRPIVLLRDIAIAVRSKLDARGAEVGCGGAPVLQPAPGQDVPCEVTGAGQLRSVSVRVEPDGSVAVIDR